MNSEEWRDNNICQPTDLSLLQHRLDELVNASRELARLMDQVFIDDAGHTNEIADFSHLRQALIAEGDSMEIRRLDSLGALHAAMQKWRLAVAEESAQQCYRSRSVCIERLRF